VRQPGIASPTSTPEAAIDRIANRCRGILAVVRLPEATVVVMPEGYSLPVRFAT
jgi:hypothetical protein